MKSPWEIKSHLLRLSCFSGLDCHIFISYWNKVLFCSIHLCSTTVRVRALKAFFRVYYLWIWNPTINVKWNSSLSTPRTNSSLSKLSDPSECEVWIGTQVKCKSFDLYFLLSLKLFEAPQKIWKKPLKVFHNFLLYVLLWQYFQRKVAHWFSILTHENYRNKGKPSQKKACRVDPQIRNCSIWQRTALNSNVTGRVWKRCLLNIDKEEINYKKNENKWLTLEYLC